MTRTAVMGRACWASKANDVVLAVVKLCVLMCADFCAYGKGHFGCSRLAFWL